jgi:PEGA domain-containing protein
MAEFRAALVDPEGYASAAPAPATEEDVSGRLLAARPMRRAETESEPSGAATAIERMTPRLRSERGPAPQVLEPPVVSKVIELPLPATSTFRQSAGERVVRRSLQRKRHRSGLFFVSATVVAAAGLSSFHLRRAVSHLITSAVALSKPATVRVNFSSDPDGATVFASGSVLGVTPLSVELPYGDGPIDYRVQKEGYVPKISSFVPNLPAAVFALLEREDRQTPSPPDLEPTALAATAPAEDPPLPNGSVAATHVASALRRHYHRARSPSPALDDGDGVLAPSGH